MTNVTNIKPTSADIMEAAKKEVVEGRSKEAKAKIKAQLLRIEAASKVLQNLENDLEVIMAEVDADLSL